MDKQTKSSAEFPGVRFEDAVLRVVLSGGGTFANEEERVAGQHFAIMAMHPDEVDYTGRGPGMIIADLEQFAEDEQFANLFAGAKHLRRASQNLYDALQRYLMDIPDSELPEGLVEAMDEMETAWHKADGTEPDESKAKTFTQPSARCCNVCGSEIDPWGFGIPLEEALEHRLAEVRSRAKMKRQFDRYRTLRPAEKIRLAMEILYDVDDNGDHHNLVHYPEELPCFEEFLADLASKLYAIEWKETSPQ